MSITWLFTTKDQHREEPKFASQVSNISSNVLTLRNPWVTDSVFMGKLYTAMIIGMAALVYPWTLDPENSFEGACDLMTMYLLTPFTFAPFLIYRIIYIKKLSNIYLNRLTKAIYYKRFSTLITFDWNEVNGGLFKRIEFAGSAFSTNYALIIAPHRKDGSLHKKDGLWIDSNEPTEPDVKYVAQVWEYLRHFMDHGTAKLPPSGEPNWLYTPLYEICLTPSQAWRHYAPWRTGEAGEMQGKKTWMLPFWAILFPYNLSVAVSWYVI
ncbi:DUF6708 domain-containing protein [Pseudomonas shirazensis]|uniref:DUF6708 domain-containing protein n=1 Tax=Pseudomonas shirazensis TaxID=2745494 RepID=UPI0016481594|nr:DUF6708 domain-containing protein [Pseudomonas shirazensis]MBV4499201.1 hypothetical protein [Pseudomonas shirazensis]